jgi:integrase
VKVTYLERSPGNWRIRIETKENGERRFAYEVVKGDRTSAEARAVELRASLAGGETVPLIGTTKFRDFAETWIRRKAGLREFTPASADVYRKHLRLVDAHLGDLRIASVSADDVERAYVALLTRRPEPYSPNTVRAIDGLLRRLFRDAIELSAVRHNPMMRVRAPKKAPGKTATIFAPRLMSLIAELDSMTNTGLGFVVRFAIASGCRRGEICGLKWSDVDWEAGTVNIRRSVGWNPDTRLYEERAPKTHAGNRTIALPEKLMAEFRERRETAMSDYVFEDREGTRRSPSALSIQISKLLTKHDLGDFTLHDLRHAHATVLLNQGRMSPKAVSNRLGHSDVTTTLRTYAHVMPADDRALAAEVGKLF